MGTWTERGKKIRMKLDHFCILKAGDLSLLTKLFLYDSEIQYLKCNLMVLVISISPHKTDSKKLQENLESGAIGILRCYYLFFLK